MQMCLDIFNDEAHLFDEVPSQDLKPEEMTLSQFLSDSRWSAYPDPQAKDQCKGMYKLMTPSGKHWSGGWIGKHRSEEEAKRSFHKKQVEYAIHGGGDVCEIVLSEYPALLKTLRSIHRRMAHIQLNAGPYVSVKVGDQVRHFHLHDFPMYSRVSVRGFVKAMELLDEARMTNEWFNPVEEMSIALERKLAHVLPEHYHPRIFIDAYGELREDDHVRFRLPIDIQQGKCLKYSEHEGVIVFNLFNHYEVVQYEAGGELVKQALFPSMLLGVKKASGEYLEVKHDD